MLPKVQQGQDMLIRELKTFQSKQQSVEEKLGVLSTRIYCFEINLAPLSKLPTNLDDIFLLASRLTTKIKHLEEEQGDQENE